MHQDRLGVDGTRIDHYCLAAPHHHGLGTVVEDDRLADFEVYPVVDSLFLARELDEGLVIEDVAVLINLDEG